MTDRRDEMSDLIAPLSAKVYGIRTGTTPLINTVDDLADVVALAPDTETAVLANIPVRLLRTLYAENERLRAVAEAAEEYAQAITPTGEEYRSLLDALDAWRAGERNESESR